MNGFNLSKTDEKEFTKLIAEDLEAGALEKATELFRYNKALYLIVGNLLRDERMKVRLGANMMMDELREEKPDDVLLAIPNLLPLLSSDNPTIRGDAADMVGIIGTNEEIPALQALLNDQNHQVIEIAEEAIDTIQNNNPLS